MTTTSPMRDRLRGWRKRKARKSDPQTSHDAVKPVTESSLKAKQDAVLLALRCVNSRACDSELLRVYQELRADHPDIYPEQSPSGLRTRRHELVQQGKVADVGLRVTLPSGRSSIVWSVVHR